MINFPVKLLSLKCDAVADIKDQFPNIGILQLETCAPLNKALSEVNV